MTFTRRTTRLAAGLGIAGATVLLLAGPAAADTSQATANAATLQLGGSPLATTGLCSSANPGNGAATDTCNQSNTLTVLGTQTAITAGLLVQQTVANAGGTSAACAGLVGTGGTIQIGAAGTCTVTGTPTPGGVVIDLGGLGTVRADAILAECTASSTGASTRRVQLVNATITLLGGTATPLLSEPAPNSTPINLGPLATVTLNEQPALVPPPPAGSASTTALDLTVLGGLPGAAPLVRLTVGTVSCGPNAVAPPISIFAGPALPMAVTGAAVVGGLFVIQRRRRSLAA